MLRLPDNGVQLEGAGWQVRQSDVGRDVGSPGLVLPDSRGVQLATQSPIQRALRRTDRPAPLGSYRADEAGLVLKPQAHRKVCYQLWSQQGCQRFGGFFFHSARATGSLLGW